MTNRFSLIRLIPVVVLIIVVGYFRDFVMVNVNYQLDFLKGLTPRSYAHSVFSFLENFSFWDVYYGKYLLTLLFTFINLGLGWWLLMALFKDKKLVKLLFAVYAIVFAVSAIFFAGGYLMGKVEQGYHVSRILMGFLQSPLPAAMLALGFPLYRASRT